MNTPLDIVEVLKLLDFWKEKRKIAQYPHEQLVSHCYIDAYKTLLINHGIKP